jgi:hypothetical protein
LPLIIRTYLNAQTGTSIWSGSQQREQANG